MRKIVYTRSDGGLSVVHPVRNRLGETLTTDAQIEQRAWDKLPADAINPRWADASEIPQDRTFRNAWVDAGTKIDHDLGKCQDITKARLRTERAPLLAALDVEFMRALEEGKPTEAIVAQKQVLRDVTAQVDAISDIEELKAITVQK